LVHSQHVPLDPHLRPAVRDRDFRGHNRRRGAASGRRARRPGGAPGVAQARARADAPV